MTRWTLSWIAYITYASYFPELKKITIQHNLVLGKFLDFSFNWAESERLKDGGRRGEGVTFSPLLPPSPPGEKYNIYSPTNQIWSWT